MGGDRPRFARGRRCQARSSGPRKATRPSASCLGRSKQRTMPPASCKRCFSPSPNRLHDLHVIAVPQFMLRMAAAWNDFAVHFDGDAALAVAGVGKQARNGGRLRAFMWLAIEIDVHARSLAPCVGQWRLWQAGPATAFRCPNLPTEIRTYFRRMRQRSRTVRESLIAARRRALVRRLAMFGRWVVARWRCVALRRTRCFLLAHLLLALHFRSALLLLHLH